MIRYKYLICTLLFLTIAANGYAQNNTNSPYTRYGFGQLSDQSFGNGKAMGGIGYGLRDGSHINALNPASYTAIDSLTFLFETGMSLQNTNFSDGVSRVNAKNSSFDYIAMQFRLNKRFAMSLGFLPFSNVGYNFNSKEPVMNYTNPNKPVPTEYTTTNTFTGDGGLHQIYLGLGFKILKGLSVGVNGSYLFGTVSHTVTSNSNIPDAYLVVKQRNVTVRDYKLDFGLQYTQQFGKKHSMTVGAVYSLKHLVNSEAYNLIQTISQGSTSNTVISENVKDIEKGFDLPHMFGGGITYAYNKKLIVGFDYTLQKWGNARFYDSYSELTDRSKYALGAEYIPNAESRNYLARMKYRVGGYYSDPYVKVKGQNGAKEYGVSVGVGLPVFNSKSVLSISGQYIKVEPQVKGLLDEQYLKLNIGLTFNERWFMKWKVQ